MWNLLLSLCDYQCLKQLPELNIEYVKLLGKPLPSSGLTCSSHTEKKYPQGWRLEFGGMKKKIGKIIILVMAVI